MKRILLVLLILVALGDGPLLSASGPISWDTPLSPDDVRIGPHYIEMPLNRIFLIRNGQLYGAVKLTEFGERKSKKNKYTSYISWYQDDGSGDFNKKNVKNETRRATSKLYGIGRLSFNFGNEEIRCGTFKLWWWGNGMVYFFERGQEFGDYGIELAPTKWMDIQEVNVFDSRLSWYKYDKKRLRKDIHIDELW